MRSDSGAHARTSCMWLTGRAANLPRHAHSRQDRKNGKSQNIVACNSRRGTLTTDDLRWHIFAKWCDFWLLEEGRFGLAIAHQCAIHQNKCPSLPHTC